MAAYKLSRGRDYPSIPLRAHTAGGVAVGTSSSVAGAKSRDDAFSTAVAPVLSFASSH
jgi:hypothetical protein